MTRDDIVDSDLFAAAVALDRAYAPLRMETAVISPARVRLALRIPQPLPAASRFSRITAHINELGLAAAVTAFAFVGSASVTPSHAIVDEAVVTNAPALTHVAPDRDEQYFLRWLRLGRYAPPADVLDPAVSPKAYSDDTAEPVARERVGLAR
ncbi:MAG TPA: hypothetical protein VM052_08050 [Candidatus Limnocylindrales bacterium]|nr:hypothetical protein [Candidatus Limnocylindrales bacterium]